MTNSEPDTGTVNQPPLPAQGPLGSSLWARIVAVMPGFGLALTIAAVATVIGHFLPIVGGPVSGIILGVVVATILKRPRKILVPGLGFSSKFVLQLSVVVLGSQLSLSQIAEVGLGSLPVMIGTLVICLVAAYFIGKMLGIVSDVRTLIGVGTGICGASAIAAVTPIIGAIGADVAYAISTIFIFNIAAVLVFPMLGHLLGMSQEAFGLFAGTAVNDTSSVVAAAATFGAVATNYAVVVKLTRTLMIIPIALGLSFLSHRKKQRQALLAAEMDATQNTEGARKVARVNVFRLVPWFLVGFLVVAAVNSFGVIPVAMHPGLNAVSVFLITVALSAIGLSTDLASFRRAGVRPLILGGSLWVVVAVSSLGLQFITGLL